MVAALGVVFGDIGTSPLYALKECFHEHYHLAVSRTNVLGILSLIIWSLILIVGVKYLVFILRADHKGEGGVLALLTLAVSDGKAGPRKTASILALGVFGAALLYGDGMITPAISVLSAVEGLNVATPVQQKYVVAITIGILIALFAVQRRGTEKMGAYFGPITFVWFTVLGLLGVYGIIKEPAVLASFNPWYAVNFFLHDGLKAFLVLGSVFLVVTGGEALYADMGHFGTRPIRFGWFTMVMPALILNYLGQGGLLLTNPAAADNPFYKLAPSWSLYPLVALATCATVIASQALITGTYSLTMQAMQLGYMPRMSVKHTSAHTQGQIYIPLVNWLLMIACIGLVIGFQSSTRLASAYGVSVTLTMLITTVLFYYVTREKWKWSLAQAWGLCAFYIVLQGAFFAANLVKLLDGGWFPLLVGLIIFTVMTTWRTGRGLLSERLSASVLPQEMFLESIGHSHLTRVPGTAIFMSANPGKTPVALLHNLKHNHVLHEQVVFLSVQTEDIPVVEPENQVELKALDNGFYRIAGHYGYMQEPDVPQLLLRCRDLGLKYIPERTTYFLGRETIVPSKRKGMVHWREWLFALMSRMAQQPSTYFRLPPGRIVELGVQVEI